MLFRSDFGPKDVECPVCGAMDNHCPNRRGLCIWCYCALANKVGSEEFAAMDKATLVREAEKAILVAMRNGTCHAGRYDSRLMAFAAAHGIARKDTAAEAARKREAEKAAREDAEAAKRYADISMRRELEREKERSRKRRAEYIAAKYGSGFGAAKPEPALSEPKPAEPRDDFSTGGEAAGQQPIQTKGEKT